MLSDVKIRNAKPREKQYKLSDSEGLYLLVAPTGGKHWRLKYRFDGKEKLLALGSYPEISLSEARARRTDARQQIAKGVDPGIVKKAKKAARIDEIQNTFELIAREWHEKFKPSWSESHAHVTITRLERDIFPWIGKRPISDIKAPELLSVLRRVEERGAGETTRRLKIICGQIFRYAIATGRAERDWTLDLKGALAPVISKHMAAITEPKKIGELLRAIDAYEGAFVTKCALRIAPLVFVRPGELREAEWAEFNLEEALWCIPLDRMKMKEPHIVPLSIQALDILRQLHPLTGDSHYVFPSARTNSRPMSNNAILAALRRMGFEKDEMSGHGFRAMARTILDEVLKFRPDIIEHQLAHVVRDPNGRAYNRTTHLDERRKMMQIWADYLDVLKGGKDLILK
jgi:integrase